MWLKYYGALAANTGLPASQLKNFACTGNSTACDLGDPLSPPPAGEDDQVGNYNAHLYGNAMPEWQLGYSPSGSLYSQYGTYLTSIQLTTNPNQALLPQKIVAQKAFDAAQSKFQQTQTAAFTAYAAFKTAMPNSKLSFGQWSDAQYPTLATAKADLDAANTTLLQLLNQINGPGYNVIAQAITKWNSAGIAGQAGAFAMNTESGGTPNILVPRFGYDYQDYIKWITSARSLATNPSSPPGLSFEVNAATADFQSSESSFAGQASGGFGGLFFFGASVGASRNETQIDSAASGFSVKFSAVSTKYVPITPGAWYDGGLLNIYNKPKDFSADSPFSSSPIWGPGGMLSTQVTGVFVAYQPNIELDFGSAKSAFAQSQWNASAKASFNIGPFTLESSSFNARGSNYKSDYSSDGSKLTVRDITDQPKILGVTVATPNYPQT